MIVKQTLHISELARKSARLFSRAWGYFRLYGAQRFTWVLASKLNGQLKQHLKAAGNHQNGPLLSPRVARPTHSPKSIFAVPLVAIIGDLNLPQCKKYRVLQKLEGLSSLGVTATHSHWQDIPRCLNALQLATFVIFYRVPMSQEFDTYLNECLRLRVPFAYDIDDPIFSREIYEKNENLRHLNPGERTHLLESSGRYLAAISRCEIGIASTPRLADALGNAGMQRVHLWRNAIDQETINVASLANAGRGAGSTQRRGEPDVVTIAYCSGSRAHDADFLTIADDLKWILERHSNTRLLVMGHAVVPKKLERLADRMSVVPFGSFADYMTALAGAHISVIPLRADSFNECKSAIRFMESAVLGKPCVSSRVGDFTNIVVDGFDGFLAASPEEWRRSLSDLILSPSLRAEVGERARGRVLDQLHVGKIVQGLSSELVDLINAD